MEMNKKHYYVIVEQENGKNYASTLVIRESENLLSVFKRYPEATSINAFSTMKRAEEIAIAWNEDFKRNGTHMFGEIDF